MNASRRQELGKFVHSGRLRQAVEGKLSRDAADLLIDIVARYCGPRRNALKAAVLKAVQSKTEPNCGHDYTMPSACPICIRQGKTVEFEPEDDLADYL